VVIPAWDEYAQEMLLEAVSSAAEQSIRPSIVVVDNASETALPVLEDVEVISLDRRVSIGAARNTALPGLSTSFVVFLDADDLLLPGALEALVWGIDRDPRLATYTLSIVDNVTGGRHRSPRLIARLLARFPPVFAVANTIWSLLPTQGCTIMRTGDVRRCGGYGDGDHGEDWVLAVSLAFRGRVSFDRRFGLRYRQRHTSPGQQPLQAATLLENARRVRQRIAQDPEIPDWVRGILPAIGATQWFAARVAHPVYRAARTQLGGWRSRRTAGRASPASAEQY
jgi:glycosyltransferase involved in cell wall biosynthesis